MTDSSSNLVITYVVPLMVHHECQYHVIARDHFDALALKRISQSYSERKSDENSDTEVRSEEKLYELEYTDDDFLLDELRVFNDNFKDGTNVLWTRSVLLMCKMLLLLLHCAVLNLTLIFEK